MTTLNDAIEQDLTYIGRWAVHLETNKQVIIVDTEKRDIGYDGIVLAPGEEGLKTVPAGDLRLIPSSVWNAEGVPQRFAYWELILNVENFVKLEDIPQSTLRKYAENLKGCWVEQLGLYYLVLKYMQGATGDVFKTLNPITSAIKYIDIEDEVRLLPLEFREWGENTEEFLDMLERCTPQPEDENTKPEEVDETDTRQDKLRQLIDNEEVRPGQWLRNKADGDEYIFIKVDKSDEFKGEWAQVFDPSEGALRNFPMSYLEPMTAYAWTKDHLPIPIPYHLEPPSWDIAPIEISHLPKTFISEFGSELSGCWAYIDDSLMVITAIIEGAVYAINPKEGYDLRYDHSESLLLNPIMLRAWGNPSAEFCDAIMRHDQLHRNKTTGTNEEPDTQDAINPGHYRGLSNNTEVIDITENLTFAAGNVVKYVVRATRIDGAIKNNPVQDLEKARWYLDREIQRLKNT